MDFDEPTFSFNEEDEEDEEDEESVGIKHLWSSSSLESSDQNESLFQILSIDDVIDLMKTSINEVKKVIDLPSSIIRILLSQFSWDEQKLYESFFDGDNKNLFADAHVKEPNSMNANSLSTKSNENNKKRKMSFCEICLSEVPDNDMIANSCGHHFCIFCWQQFLTHKIMDEGNCNEILCANRKCDKFVDDDTISYVIKDERVIKRYNQLVMQSFVASNKLLRWCPGVDCSNAVKVTSIEFLPIECSCGHVYCFTCGEKWHEPARCVIMKSWAKRCSGDSAEKIDSETANWILSNTKECPKCKASIEKNGGCNHMTCRKCRIDFCWICLGDWKNHQLQSCNKYDHNKESVDTSRGRLQRYIHYWTRFQSHQKSLEAEENQFLQVESKMEKLQKYDMSLIEVLFLKEAAIILCKCRQTLMYSYPFAFYLARNNDSIIFEDNQQYLETSTEKLAEFIEREIAKDSDIKAWKQSILDTSKYCETRRKNLVEHINKGYEFDSWEFNSLD